MKIWLKKIAVAFVAVTTLGLYVPPIHMDAEAEDRKESVHDADFTDGSRTATATVTEADLVHPSESDVAAESAVDYKQLLTEKAVAQTKAKLGPKITDKVEDEFMEAILPAMESVLDNVFTEAGEASLPYYAITEQPAEGTGERIFHVHDFHNNKDVARFDVRRDNRPQEGYWFNFHYHLSTDNFESHHEIGEIYWNKNVPPKWMS